MPTLFFYLFAALAVGGAIALISLRNPVSSALAMVASFLGLAALFVGLNAYFVGVIQILVYAGAIMVLFLFIIMLLDLKEESRKVAKPGAVLAGALIPVLFLVQLCGVLPATPGGSPAPLALEEAAGHFADDSPIHASLEKGALPDVHLVGLTLFGNASDNDSIGPIGYNFPLQIIGVLLLVATVGVVALSRRSSRRGPAPDRQSD